MIPIIMKLTIAEQGKRRVNLYLPLFLLWILLLPFLILLLPFILIAALVLWPSGWGKKILMIIPHGFSIINSLSGLLVYVEDRGKKIFIGMV